MLRIFLLAVLVAFSGSTSATAEGAAAVPDEPAGYRMDDFRSPVPATLKGARVVNADEAEKLWKEKRAVFIDVYPRPPKPANLPAGTVWRDPTHQSIAGARWLPNVGYGALSDAVDAYYKSELQRLTGGDMSRPIVLFCLKNCWMSWNAAKRALEYGYRDVTWFSEGTDGWQDIGNELVNIVPDPK
jgi:PQQ-dependent catabolism-associated CXXCW motif protein